MIEACSFAVIFCMTVPPHTGVKYDLPRSYHEATGHHVLAFDGCVWNPTNHVIYAGFKHLPVTRREVRRWGFIVAPCPKGA